MARVAERSKRIRPSAYISKVHGFEYRPLWQSCLLWFSLVHLPSNWENRNPGPAVNALVALAGWGSNKKSKSVVSGVSAAELKVPLPTIKRDFNDFLSVKENKTELQRFLLRESYYRRALQIKLLVAAGVFEDKVVCFPSKR